MVTEVYGHILGENRRKNVGLMETETLFPLQNNGI